MAAQLQIFLFFFLVVSSSASARLLNVGNVLQNPPVLVLPCHTDGEGNSNQQTEVINGIRAYPTPRFDAAAKNRKYVPLVFNMLPKGPTTPSGPSKGTNSINN
ncbi:hypothetical protein RchiOBHm_Chr1g0372031 [Rosa chinensis]|uniref:Uncharacterized protein n=1 Tax=Rosa chinensis TaxID=74649 RepID=A0A2P6SLP1_ROSCH|nr:hypothetical protein RchiOBHm_Chr1g0372031 [Rosa chinensis]